jgi:hypothetical protein
MVTGIDSSTYSSAAVDQTETVSMTVTGDAGT